MTGDVRGEVHLSAERYDELLEELEDLRDRISVHERSGVTIPADKLTVQLGLAPGAVGTPGRQRRMYSYSAQWSREDEAWIGLVAEFPSLSHLAATPADAVAGAAELVDGILADMVETGETPPVRSDRR